MAQARSDLDVFIQLQSSNLPTSHRLHYLQMWLEKLCKAYLWLPDVHYQEHRYRHNVVSKVLPRLVAEHWRRLRLPNQPDMAAVRRICREVDLLHPQVDDDGRRPQNVEYPWLDANGGAVVPAQWAFRLARSLYTNPGRLTLKAATLLTRRSELLLR